MPFFIIFVVIPILELMVFVAVSDEIGFGTALLLCLLTAVCGGYLVRQQGLQKIAHMREALGQGRMPLNELFDGFCLIAAGALLITPGFLTDSIGFALLVPRFRAYLRNLIKAHTNWAVDVQGFETRSAPRDPNVIEGEFETVEVEYEKLDEEPKP